MGSKASKLVRVIRLIRLMRLVKLYKSSNTLIAKDNTNLVDEEEQVVQQMIQEEAQEGDKDEPLPEESKIGKTLSDVTTKTVIIMVLVVMLSVPLFSFDTYADETTSFQGGLDYICLYDSNPNGTAFESTYTSYLTRHRSIDTPIIYVVAGYLSYDDPAVDSNALRDTEQTIVYPSNDNLTYYYVAIFDLRSNTHLEAILSISQTFFVCIVLTIGAIIFTKDANDLVIGPIEQMMVKVQRIAKNPLEAAKEEENEAVALQKLEREERLQNKNSCCKVWISVITDYRKKRKKNWKLQYSNKQ